jgi:amino acid adenylation domain-containing protein
MHYLIFDQLSDRAREQGERIAMRVDDRQMTFAEADKLAKSVASFLIEIGTGRGDRIGLIGPKSEAYVCSQYGTLRAGGCYVPIDKAFPIERTFQIVEDCQIKTIFADTTNVERILGAESRPACLQHVVSFDSGGESHGGLSLHSFESVSEYSSDPNDAHRPVDTDLAYIMYTSGSTGKPKGVMLSHRNILTYVEWCTAEFGLGPDDVMVNVAPFTFDISGMEIFNMAAAGAQMVLVENQTRITTVLDAIQRTKANFLATVPTVIGTMVNNPRIFGRYDLSSLKTIVSGAAVCPPVFMKTLHEHLPEATLYNLYGPTEATIYCLYYRVDDPDGIEVDKPLPIGIPFENTEAYVVDAEGKEVPRGQEGELILRGSHVALGYFNNPEKTGAAFKNFPLQPHLREDVYYTGDVARQDASGVFHFLGRNDDMVKSRGYRIELNEIDLALSTITDHLDSFAVVAIPDELIENKLVAIVVRHEGSEITEGEVKAACKERLPVYMVPDEVHFRDELPQTSSGKINKKALVQELSA